MLNTQKAFSLTQEGVLCLRTACCINNSLKTKNTFKIKKSMNLKFIFWRIQHHPVSLF